MISKNQIDRLLENEEYRQLIQRILANGRCRSAMARQVLGQAECAAPAATGLALQRLAELTYRPCELAHALARKLTVMQRRDGLFGYGCTPSNDVLLAATATALRGLMTLQAQTRSHNHSSTLTHTDFVSSAITKGLTALRERYAMAEDVNADAVGWAIVLWQLGDVPEFRQMISVDALLELLNDSAQDLVEDELCRYAHAVAA